MVVLKFVSQMCSTELVFFQLQCSEGGLVTFWNKDYLTGRKGESITTKTMVCVCISHVHYYYYFFLLRALATGHFTITRITICRHYLTRIKHLILSCRHLMKTEEQYM